MPSPPARPGPRDGSRPFFVVLGGVVIALILYVVKLIVLPDVLPNNAVIWVAGGVVLGLLLLWRGPWSRGRTRR